MNNSTVDIMNQGMNCLRENLGIIGAEQFISVIMRERFDYTEWQRKYFDDIGAEEFHSAAIAYAKEHPFDK